MFAFVFFLFFFVRHDDDDDVVVVTMFPSFSSRSDDFFFSQNSLCFCVLSRQVKIKKKEGKKISPMSDKKNKKNLSLLLLALFDDTEKTL